MSIPTLEGSPLFSFAGNALFTRNDPVLNVSLLIRIASNPSSFRVITEAEFASKIFPQSYDITIPFYSFPLSQINFGTGTFERQYPSGWNRIKLLVFGVTPLTYAWGPANSQSLTWTDGIRNFTQTFYEHSVEYFWPNAQVVGDFELQEIPAPLPNSQTRRIPLNSVAIDEERPNPNKLYHLVRYVEASVFANTAGTWYVDNRQNLGLVRPERNALVNLTSPAGTQEVGNGWEFNAQSINPTAPVTFNGAPITIFENLPANTNDAICAVPISITPESSFRPITYEDITRSVLY